MIQIIDFTDLMVRAALVLFAIMWLACLVMLRIIDSYKEQKRSLRRKIGILESQRKYLAERGSKSLQKALIDENNNPPPPSRKVESLEPSLFNMTITAEDLGVFGFEARPKRWWHSPLPVWIRLSPNRKIRGGVPQFKNPPKPLIPSEPRTKEDNDEVKRRAPEGMIACTESVAEKLFSEYFTKKDWFHIWLSLPTVGTPLGDHYSKNHMQPQLANLSRSMAPKPFEEEGNSFPDISELRYSNPDMTLDTLKGVFLGCDMANEPDRGCVSLYRKHEDGTIEHLGKCV